MSALLEKGKAFGPYGRFRIDVFHLEAERQVRATVFDAETPDSRGYAGPIHSLDLDIPAGVRDLRTLQAHARNQCRVELTGLPQWAEAQREDD